MRDLQDLGKTPEVAFVMLLLLGSEIVANLFQPILRWFWKFVSTSQKKSLIDLSFGHNLCCKYSNGLCELILNI